MRAPSKQAEQGGWDEEYLREQGNNFLVGRICSNPTPLVFEGEEDLPKGCSYLFVPSTDLSRCKSREAMSSPLGGDLVYQVLNRRVE
jgi:hypothetical protein